MDEYRPRAYTPSNDLYQPNTGDEVSDTNSNIASELSTSQFYLKNSLRLGLVYCLICTVNLFILNAFGLLILPLKHKYNVTDFQYNVYISVNLVVESVATIPAAFALNKLGLRNGLLLANFGNSIITIIRCIPMNTGNAYDLMFYTGQASAVFTSFILVSPTKFAATFYDINKRRLAVSFFMCAQLLGLSFGYIFPPFFDLTWENKNTSKWYILVLIIFQLILSAITLVSSFLFLPNIPRVPVNFINRIDRWGSVKSIRKVLSLRQFWIFSLVYFGIYTDFITRDFALSIELSKRLGTMQACFKCIYMVTGILVALLILYKTITIDNLKVPMQIVLVLAAVSFYIVYVSDYYHNSKYESKLLYGILQYSLGLVNKVCSTVFLAMFVEVITDCFFPAAEEIVLGAVYSLTSIIQAVIIFFVFYADENLTVIRNGDYVIIMGYIFCLLGMLLVPRRLEMNRFQITANPRAVADVNQAESVARNIEDAEKVIEEIPNTKVLNLQDNSYAT